MTGHVIWKNKSQKIKPRNRISLKYEFMELNFTTIYQPVIKPRNLRSATYCKQLF